MAVLCQIELLQQLDYGPDAVQQLQLSGLCSFGEFERGCNHWRNESWTSRHDKTTSMLYYIVLSESVLVLSESKKRFVRIKSLLVLLMLLVSLNYNYIVH